MKSFVREELVALSANLKIAKSVSFPEKEEVLNFFNEARKLLIDNNVIDEVKNNLVFQLQHMYLFLSTQIKGVNYEC